MPANRSSNRRYRKRTYRRRRYNRRYRSVFNHNRYHKIRLIMYMRIRVVDDPNSGLGTGFKMVEFDNNQVLGNGNVFNTWLGWFKSDPEFTYYQPIYNQCKIQGFSIVANPSFKNFSGNTQQFKTDATCRFILEPITNANSINVRELLLDPNQSGKIYFKISALSRWMQTAPTTEQEDENNKLGFNFRLVGNSGTNKGENCPMWTLRCCAYILFRSYNSS